MHQWTTNPLLFIFGCSSLLICFSNRADGVVVMRFQEDGVATNTSVAIYEEPLSLSRKMRSVTLCARFNIFFLHIRGTILKLEDTVNKRESMLKGELWVEKVRPVLAHTYNFQILEQQLWAFRWYHICFTYDHVKTLITTYLDGRVSNEQVYDIGGEIYGDRCQVGQGDSVERSFSGDLTQVNVWDRVLSENEVRDLATCKVDLTGNYISWEANWKIQNVETREVPLQKLCDQEVGTVYFWFPLLTDPTAQYLCEALGGHLPIPKTKDEVNFWINLGKTSNPEVKSCHFKLWTPLHDKAEDGVWRRHDNKIITDIAWTEKEPNGIVYENCALINVNGVEDIDCKTNTRCAVCPLTGQKRFSFLGICEIELRNIYFVPYQDKPGHLVFKGYGKYHIRKSDSEWVWVDVVNNITMARMEEFIPDYPMGRRWWQLEQEVCGQEAGGRRLLSLSPCDWNNFTCADATCIPLDFRCDLKYDCKDKSDELDCQLVGFPDDYQYHLPPRPVGEVRTSLPMTARVSLESLSITTLDMTIEVSYELTMTWIDSRIYYLNLKTNDSFNVLPNATVKNLWTPQVTFVNTDGIQHTEVDKEVTMFVSRQNDVDKRDDAAPDEVDIFFGRSNSMSIRRKYITVYNCDFDLVLYPFDIQQCRMHLRITSSSRDFVMFNQGNSTVSYVGNNLLLEYEVGTITLEYDNSGTYSDMYVRLPLSRRYGYAILNIYMPSFVLLVVSYVTLFFRPIIFDVRMMSALTAQLVIATLFSQVSASLPKTSYFKMVDIWLLFCIGMTFTVIVFHAFVDHLVNEGEATSTPVSRVKVNPASPSSNIPRISFMKFKDDVKSRGWWCVMISKVMVLVIFCLFNLIYWGYIMF